MPLFSKKIQSSSAATEKVHVTSPLEVWIALDEVCRKLRDSLNCVLVRESSVNVEDAFSSDNRELRCVLAIDLD